MEIDNIVKNIITGTSPSIQNVLRVIDIHVSPQSDMMLGHGSGKGRKEQELSHCSAMSGWFQFSRKWQKSMDKPHLESNLITIMLVTLISASCVSLPVSHYGDSVASVVSSNDKARNVSSTATFINYVVNSILRDMTQNRILFRWFNWRGFDGKNLIKRTQAVLKSIQEVEVPGG